MSLHVYGVGRLTKKPEVNQYGETTVTKGRAAFPRRRKQEGKPEADFLNLTLFGKQGEAFKKHLDKGSQVFIMGDLIIDEYENKNGDDVRVPEIIVDRFEFVGKKDSDDDDDASEASEKKAKNKAKAKAKPKPEPENEDDDDDEEFMDGDDEELPFN